MEFGQIYKLCWKLFLKKERGLRTMRLFKELYSGEMKEDLVEKFLIELDEETEAMLEGKIDAMLMDSMKCKYTRKEHFMLRLRLINACYILDALAKMTWRDKHGFLFQSCKRGKECVLWSLTTLWNFRRDEYIHQQACDFVKYGVHSTPWCSI